MNNIGLFYNPRVSTARPLAEEIAAWLKARNVHSWTCSTKEKPPDDELCRDATDLLVTLGGDGTILRAMPLVAPLAIPVLGLNLGRVGFLTECEPDEWPAVMTQIMEGKGTIEERLMLQVTLYRQGEQIAQDVALNDAVISRGGLALTMRLETLVEGTPLTRYVADGLILATATGSTAYSYAVGGPILPPWIDNILLSPIAAHLSLDRPLVLNDEATVEVIVHTRVPGTLTVDGHLVGELLEGDRVCVERSALKARFLRLRSRGDFYRTLVKRLTPREDEAR
ncbi:MAG: NAD(+)/NADH kinase [Anaerolineae bacterium]